MCQASVQTLRRRRPCVQKYAYKLHPWERSLKNAHERKSQEWYKHDYDRRLRGTLVFMPNNYVFDNNPQLQSTSDSNAEAISKHVYKLQPLKAEPF